MTGVQTCALPISRGEVDGTITTMPRGGGGFGYDPVFAPTGSTLTFAEMTPEAKHAISHRGRALRAAAAALWDSVPSARREEP